MTQKKEDTLESLQEKHSEMLATAHDLGMDVPEELRSNFTDAGAGAGIVSSLDALIRERRGLGGVVNDDAKRQNADVKAAPAKKRTTAKKASAKKAAAKPKTESASAKKADAEDVSSTGEKQVSKAAKKTKAKKTAKKAASNNARKRVKFTGDEKISVVAGKENPAREGTGKYERIQNVLKHNGKTVKTYLAKGKAGTLGWCVAKGLVKVA